MPDMLFVGHASIDRIRNVNGERVQPGGAAIYAAMGAKTIMKDVGIITAVGDDYPFWQEISSLDTSRVKRVKTKSTRFFIKYDKDWNAAYKSVAIGPGSRITTKDVISALAGGVKIVHLAPMNPPKVLRIVKTIKAEKPAVKICINSCINYMDKKNNRQAIIDAASLADVFILNEKELHSLTGKEIASEAVKCLRSRMVVLTLGEIGAIVRIDGTSEFVPAMAAITKNAVDVTGAGDTWSGAFLASLYKSGSWIRAVSFASLVSAIKCRDWNFQKIKALAFDDVSDVYSFPVLLKEKSRQLTLSDSVQTAEKMRGR